MVIGNVIAWVLALHTFHVITLDPETTIWTRAIPVTPNLLLMTPPPRDVAAGRSYPTYSWPD